MTPFVAFYDKLQKKEKFRDSNRKVLDSLKDSMGAIYKQLDDLKKKQCQKPKVSKVVLKSSKAGTQVKKK